MLRGSARIRVAWLGGCLEAAAVFRVTDADARWQLDLLAVRDEADERAVDAALRCAVQAAGTAGARRLFARMPTDLVDDRALRLAGFVPYMTEHVLQFNGRIEGVQSTSERVRRMHPADVWGVQQLYLELVPRQVQYAEAMTSRAWDALLPLRPGMKRSSGWVVEEHGRVRAFARISTREDARRARLDVLVAPEVHSDARELVAAAVTEAQGLHGTPCLAGVPAYQGELVRALEDMGFGNATSQTAFVCYTTVSSRAHVVAVDLRKELALPAEPAPVARLGTAGAPVTRSVDRLTNSSRSSVGQTEHDLK